MNELLKNLPSTLKDFKKEHCITLMTLISCIAVTMIPSNNSHSNKVITNETDCEEYITE